MEPLTLSLVVIVAAGCALACVRTVLRRWPRHRSCPACGCPTAALRHEGVLRSLSWLVRRRWCSACGWTGSAREGPAPDPRGGELGHTSGFRWSPVPRNRTGFRWGADRRGTRRTPEGGLTSRPGE